MSAIAYHRPATLGEAAKLAESDSDARILAGGQSVLPSMKLGLLTPSAFIDLGALGELRGIRADRKSITIGAMTPHAAVATSPEIAAALPSLAKLAAGIGDPQVRNRGTIGGSLANSDPAADYPAAVLALNATVRTNRRALPADGFFKGLFETALAPGEIITAVEFPIATRAAYVKFHQPASRFALVGVFVAQTQSGVRVAVTGAGPCAFRVEALERALSRRFDPQACEGISIPPDDLNTDIHARRAVA
jgi:carbon-monoxide dehydrogenase medium subunit